MKNYETLFNDPCKPNEVCGCESVKGNAIEVEIGKGDCEVRADIVVSRTSGVRIWGMVKDCDGLPVSYALVKLVKVVNVCGKRELEGIAHTITDCHGMYQFEVNPCEVGTKYKVLVHKAASGNERKVLEENMDCNPCNERPCPPRPKPPCGPCK